MKNIVFLLITTQFFFGQQKFKSNYNIDCYSNKVIQYVDSLSVDDPGFSIAVFNRDSILYSFNHGRVKKDEGISINIHTPFFIASVTKSFVAAGILKLEEDDQLSLNDNITKYLPNLPSFYSEVSLIDLLTHSSGIPDYTDYLDTDDGPKNNLDVMEILKKADSLNFKPKTRFSYNNAAFVLLSKVINKVSGKSFEDYITESFLKPLNMNGTYFSPKKISKNRAYGYVKIDNTQYVMKDTKEYHIMGSTGMYSSVNDLIKWMRVFDAENDFLSSSIKHQMLTYLVNASGKEGYMNMGWFNETLGKRSRSLVGFEQDGMIGVNGGFRSYLIKARNHDFYYIVLSNQGELPHDIIGENLLECFFTDKEN